MEALARTAMEYGQAALLASKTDDAVRWLDRAHRLVPTDPNVMLMLASARLAESPARSADLFRRVAAEHGVRQAFVGLAASCLRLGEGKRAADAMAAALSGHIYVPDMAPLANHVAGPAGWCGLRADGTVEIRSDRAARITLDGIDLPQPFLPVDWQRHRVLTIMAGRTHLLGSPIRLDMIARLAGCTEICADGIRGWAWHPADPDRDPVLTLRWPELRKTDTIIATDSASVPHTGPLARPRSFLLRRDDLPRNGGLLHIVGPDGRRLHGSPLNPWADTDGFAAAAAALAVARRDLDSSVPAFGTIATSLPVDVPLPPSPIGADHRRRAVGVVIPVHNGGDVVRTCLASVLATVPAKTLIVAVDDGSTDPELIVHLNRLAGDGRIRLLRHKQAQGFPSAANAGIRAARGRDVVLLNSDTLLPPGWLERLSEAANSAVDIGTVTPFSNDASILSYPREAGRNLCPDLAATRQLDRLAWKANGAAVVDIPVGVGFCLYLRRDCLNAVGLLRADIFAQGYGEENDLCLRARRLGWRNVALPGLFVGHVGGSTFGASATHLRIRNGKLLERLHPGHDALIQDFVSRDPLIVARRGIDLARWRQAERSYTSAVILITHDDGGGVEQRVAQSASAHRDAGRRPVVLRPARTASGSPAISVHDGIEDDFASLVYALPQETPALLALLRAARPQAVEVHHLLDHAPDVYGLVTSLGLPYDVHVHDYLWICPQVALVPQDRYCGEPDLHACESCAADHGHFLHEDISVADLRARSSAFLAGARAVIAPSRDAATRMVRYVPGLDIAVIPHEDDTLIPLVGPSPPASGRVRVCLAGSIGIHKGYDILLACARDAARRALDLEFVVVGTTIDDERLLATGRVFITGRYAMDECVDVIRAQRAHLGFVASIWPETWCLALGDMWRGGLSAAAFDIGAPAERIRRTGRGFLLPFGLSTSAINTALMTAAHAAAAETGSGIETARRKLQVAYSHSSDAVLQVQK